MMSLALQTIRTGALRLAIGLTLLFVVAVAAPLGCGTEFPNALVNVAGDEVHIERLSEIANDPDLSDSEKRQFLEDLGIQDEDVQDFILLNL